MVGSSSQEHAGVLSQAGGQPHALEFAAGELIDGPIGHVRGAGEGQCPVDGAAICIREPGEALPMRVPTEGDDFTDADSARMRARLREQSDGPGEFLGCQGGGVGGGTGGGTAACFGSCACFGAAGFGTGGIASGADDDIARGDRVEASQRAQHGRFARAVGAEESRHLSGDDRQADIVDDLGPVILQEQP